MPYDQAPADLLDDLISDYATRRMAEVRPSDRFAHYTSGDAAEKIIKGDLTGNRSLWLRNSRFMNDYSEVKWGQYCLGEAFRDWRLQERFKRALDAIQPQLFPTIAGALINEQHALSESAYLISLALHSHDECRTGKLSMWRAYGGVNNVCMVFNTPPFLTQQEAYELVISPVLYGGPGEVVKEFEALCHRLQIYVSELRLLDPDIISIALKRALDLSVLSTKHPGFHEETEWRVIHQHSGLRPDPPFFELEIAGAHQRVYQVPLENRPEDGLYGAELAEILDRVIVGPSANPSAAVSRWTGLLRDAGVSHAEDRVSYCHIPLRRQA